MLADLEAMPMGQTPLLLLPGTLCDARVFAPMIQPLGPGRPILVADTVGARTTPDMARKILATAPPRFALAGFSLGGIVALEMIAQAPHRITHLALIDTTARPDAIAVARRSAVARARIQGFGPFVDSLLPTSLSRATRHDILRENILAMAESIGLRGFDEQADIAINRVDSRPRLGAIAVPTAVIYGADDQTCPLPVQLEMAHGIRGARLVAIPDAGHFAPLEQPDAVAGALSALLATEPALEESP